MAGTEAPAPSPESDAAREAFRRRYGLEGRGPGVPAATPPAEATPAPEGASPEGRPGKKPKTPGGTNEISSINITFKAISWTSLFPEANKETASVVLNEIKNSPLFDSDSEIPEGRIDNEEAPGVFSFKVVAKLKRPLKL